MNKRAIIVFVAVVVMLGGAGGLFVYLKNQREAPAQSKKEPSTYYVNARPVKYTDVFAEVEASGRVISKSLVNLISEVQGRILPGKVLLKKGESFRKGDTLVRIYKKDAEYNLKSRKSSFLNLLASILPDLKIDFKKQYPRWKTFFNNLDTDKDFPPLPEINSNQLKVFLASRNLLSNYYSIKSEEERLKKYTLEAPFDGTFTEVNLESGSVASPGSRIARMIRTDVLEVEVPVPAKEAKFLEIGDSVVLHNDDNKKYTGVVVRKASFVDQATQSRSIFVGVKNEAANPVYQGQYLQARLDGRVMEGVMELPRNAVFENDNVYVVIDGKLQEKGVKVQKLNEKTLYFNGLKEGTDIVTEPLINAREGNPVEILK
ncbi:MAG: efflux RND transporter periplasmic adaptor subunit [Bacteroidales bacterium]|nr:efflux RND transporter periplasmic adaptor subunit [Bacteroidales bacterium]MCF8332570.1 efflux RND transporter periplasmic adaptor subunit [Bacteroidales bacterium]